MGHYLRYRDRSTRESELGFLTEAERLDYSSNGSEAIDRFKPKHRDLWRKWAEADKSKLNAQIIHRNQWRIDMKELVDFLDAEQAAQEDFQVQCTVKEYKHRTDFQSYFISWLPAKLQKLRKKPDWVNRQMLQLQCYMLARLSVVPYCKERKQLWELTENEFVRDGACLDSVYPVVATQAHLFLLDSLTYNHGYGPNAFPWKLKRVEQGYLRHTPATLYLVSINVGGLTGSKDCFVWKIGITTKDEVVGESAARCRYSGKYSQYIELIRQKRYPCGELAFIREQVYIDQVSTEKKRSLHNKYDHEKLSSRDLSVLGSSEWVLEGRPKNLASEYFDRLTMAD
jgi:hypothetical protein